MSEVARKALFNLAAKTVVTIFTLLSFLYLGKSGDQQAVATLGTTRGHATRPSSP